MSISKTRLEVLLENALSWVYEHCMEEEDYLEVLEEYIGMSASEIEEYSGL